MHWSAALSVVKNAAPRIPSLDHPAAGGRLGPSCSCPTEEGQDYLMTLPESKDPDRVMMMGGRAAEAKHL